MNFFESMRRANADFYTAHPLEQLGEDQLEGLAQQQGLTVSELKAQQSKRHIEMTCPLCGQASTHVVMCKGCGGGSWGFEWEEAHGHDVIDRLRAGLTITLTTVGKEQGVRWDEKQIHYAVNHAYQMGGCLVCADCWHHTLPTDAYQTCPLYLHSERILAHNQIPFQSLFLASLNGEQPREWVRRIVAHWTQHWNTAGQTLEETQAIAAWRSTLLHGALGNPESFLQRSVDQEAEIQVLLRRLGLTE